ncbi:MAG TPA: glycine/sarcosine/betaine reductase complex component C subunit beta [Clostridia bacterium]|nr:glycine/sarcosine/betaine reductase complex component C subunit beta [Clostridia bacterium]
MFPVIKAASYILVHAPDILVNNGSTQTMERAANPNSEYLQKIRGHLRKYEEVVAYPPNQVYIGNKRPGDLWEMEQPWYQNSIPGAERYGSMGEIMPQDEFYALIKISDAFDLVRLEKGFTESVKKKFAEHRLLGREMADKLGEGVDLAEIETLIKDHHAEAMYMDGDLVGCVRRAHDRDINLSAHVMFENLVTKASGILSLVNLFKLNDIDPGSIDYVIECSEEACGDMNQRGGGNFAKAVAEVAGCVNATGSDLRGFCAAPTHALIEAAALVKAGVYKNVAIVAGGATAKLGMNGRDHVAKGIPLLEDVLGGFAVLVGENDGVNPVLRTDLVGYHTVGTGSSPQAVITSLVIAPLEKGGLKITDIDKYSVEMQNPEITVPAGAGDVPAANYKMIGALGVKRNELSREDLGEFAKKHGMPGFAPTQGHIPSGVPFIGHCRDMMLEGKLQKAMIVGKGSLFLGRMTNLFDGVSIVMEKNSGKVEQETGVSEEKIKAMIAQSLREFAAQLLAE